MTEVSESLLATVWCYLSKPFTHKYCDTCGFTKDEVYVTEYFMESGFRQCKKCIDKSKSNCCLTICRYILIFYGFETLNLII